MKLSQLVSALNSIIESGGQFLDGDTEVVIDTKSL